MENIKKLLEEVAKISKMNAENTKKIEEAGERFNIFPMCGVGDKETKHSAIIAEILNPRGSHGQKHKFLECFLETLRNECGFSIEFDCETANLSIEEPITSGFLDVLITDNQNRAIIIENKRPNEDYDDRWGQLKKYDEYAKETYKGGYKILYLTIEGDKASEQSAQGVDYMPISYRKTIIEWLENCNKIDKDIPTIKYTIKQYINHLKELTNQDMDTKNGEKIIEILSKTENLRAAQEIYYNYEAVFDILAKNHFFQKMKEFANQKGLVFKTDECGENFLTFRLTHPKWKNEFEIFFSDEGDGENTTYGIPKSEKTGVRKSKNVSKNLIGYKENKHWLAYKLYEVNLDTWIKDIVESDKFFNDCKKIIEELFAAIEKSMN